MTSMASSIQPRPPAMREERSGRVVLVGQKRERRDGEEIGGCTSDMGGDCTFEGLAKAARSLEFCASSVLLAQTEKDCSRQACLLRSAAILGFLLKEKQMAFCSACGSEVGGAAFCPKCGAAQGAPAAAAPSAAPAGGAAAAPPTAGMEENIAGLLCYVFGWVSGLIFLLIDKRPFVKFHAAQSIAFNIAFFAAGWRWPSWVLYSR